MLDFTTKTDQVTHNYNLIKNNPEISLKEFLDYSIIDGDENDR